MYIHMYIHMYIFFKISLQLCRSINVHLSTSVEARWLCQLSKAVGTSISSADGGFTKAWWPSQRDDSNTVNFSQK